MRALMTDFSSSAPSFKASKGSAQQECSWQQCQKQAQPAYSCRRCSKIPATPASATDYLRGQQRPRTMSTTAAGSRHTFVQCQSQQPNRWQKDEVSRQVMAPAVNTWTGHRCVGHCASDSAATSRAYFPSNPRSPSDPYATTLQQCLLAVATYSRSLGIS